MSTFTIPMGNYPTQVFQIPERTTPQGMTGCLISIERNTTATPTIWVDPLSIIETKLDFSFDNKATWENSFFVSRQAGGLKSKNGVEVAQSLSTMYFKPSPTHCRGTIEIINGPIRTSITFTTLD